MIKFVLENFDTIFRNEKSLESLNKIILDLAIRGKLVEQNPEDEPASELLTRIKEEKERLIKEKVIKKEKELPKIEKDEIPFEIPESWEWVRLKEIAYFNPRNIADENLEVSFIPMKLILDEYENYHSTEEKLWKEVKNGFTHFQNDDIGIAKITPCFENRKSVIFKELKNGLGAGTTELYIVRRINKEISNKYLLNIFKSESFIRGGVDTYTGTAGQQRVKKEFVENYLISLPPLAEQQRIVEKVERLQELIKNLKEVYLSNEESRLNLKKFLLVEIEKSNSDKDFDKVIRSKEDIKDIRNLILSLAIKGKLVEQNPEDEPASELLTRIKEEKERLIKEKVIKKEKELPKIEKDEIPFEIPENWEWVRLGEIVSILGDGLHGTPTYDETGDYYFINGNNLIDKKIVIKENTKKVSYNEYLKYKKDLNDRTIFVSINGTIGSIAFYNNENIILGKSACYFNLLNEINKEYIYYYLKSMYFLKYVTNEATGTTIKNVSLNVMRRTKVTLPSLAEQQRIVERVEKLMSICDMLEEKIVESERVSEKLLESLVKYEG